MNIAFSEWLPDMSDNAGDTLAKNVIPKMDSYGELKSLTSFSTALTSACLGAFWMQDGSGVVYNFAGDTDDLYQLTGGTTWNNVSKSAAAYSAVNWEFEKFGDRVLATSLFDNLQYFDVGVSSNFADLAGSPPKAARIAVVRDFVVLGDLENAPNRVQWSGFNASELWTPSPLTTQADFQDLYGKGGRVQRIVPGEYGVIFQEHSIRKMNYIGPPLIFQIDEVERGKGTPAPNSVCWTGTTIFYYGHDGFYIFDGMQSTPIGNNKVDLWFKANADASALGSMRGVVDRRNRLVMWAFSSSASLGNDRLIIYNWGTGKWSYAEVDTEIIAEYVSPGYTLDELTTVIGLSDIDSASISVDSDAYKGGALNIQAFNSSHQAGTFSGTGMDACITTVEISDESHRLLETSSVRPDVEGAGTVTVQVGTRDKTSDNVAYTTAATLNDIGAADVRVSARYQRYQLNITNGFTHGKGVKVEQTLGGLR